MLSCRLEFFAWYSQETSTDNQNQVVTQSKASALNGTGWPLCRKWYFLGNVMNSFCSLQYMLKIFYPKNRTKSIIRIELCAHDFYPKNRLTKHSSILRIESYYAGALTCLQCFVLYIQFIHTILNIKYMMTT